MSREQLLTYVSAVLTTALETEPAAFPETMAYLAMGADISKWETVKSVLVGGGLITTVGHSVKLTDKGRELAAKCNEVLAH